MRRCLLLFFVASLAFAEDPPKDIRDFFRTLAENLADQDTSAFLNHFDRSMPGFGQLRGDVEALHYRDVASTVEIAKDDGDDRARAVDLDWIIRIDLQRPRRELIHCKIQKQGKKWKIVSFDPIHFFGL